MQKKESSLLLMAKVIVAVSSVIGIVTIWGISYYMISSSNEAQIPNNRIVLTQAACAKLEGNAVARDDCYLKVAKARQDAGICAKAGIAEIKALCYVELAEMKNDVAICKNDDVSASLQKVCEDYFNPAQKAEGAPAEAMQQ